MISAERLGQLIALHTKAPQEMPSNCELDTCAALHELEAARARIASLEQQLTVLPDEVRRTQEVIRENEFLRAGIRAQGLSPEDREACLTGASFIEFVTAKAEPESENQRIVIEMDRRKAAILRRLGAQTT